MLYPSNFSSVVPLKRDFDLDLPYPALTLALPQRGTLGRVPGYFQSRLAALNPEAFNIHAKDTPKVKQA
jgi:hypothetical protein